MHLCRFIFGQHSGFSIIVFFSFPFSVHLHPLIELRGDALAMEFIDDTFKRRLGAFLVRQLASRVVVEDLPDELQRVGQWESKRT